MAGPSPAMPQIDPAEALIVVTGIEPFLRHTSRDLGGAIVKSEQLPETIEAKIYRFINRDEREAPADLPPFDFDATVLSAQGPAILAVRVYDDANNFVIQNVQLK